MFPAHAGVILSSARQIRNAYNVPRTRGGDPSYHVCGENPDNMFPAHAGVILLDALTCWVYGNVPRTRGGDP